MTILSLSSIMVSLVLSICTCTYLRPRFPGYIHPKLPGWYGALGRFAVVGDRLSPLVSALCVVMAVVTLFYR